MKQAQGRTHNRRKMVVVALVFALAGTLMVSQSKADAVTAGSPPASHRVVVHAGDSGASSTTYNTTAQTDAFAKAIVNSYVQLPPSQVPKIPITSGNCRGWSGAYIYTEWWVWSIQVYAFDSCMANVIRAGMQAGTGFLGLFAIISAATTVGIPVAAISGLLSALGAIGSAVIGFCSSQGTGMDIRQQIGGPAVWCNNQ